MRGYLAVFAAHYSVEECVSIVANVESISPTIAADTEWIARKLSGMRTEQEDLHGVVDEEALEVVTAVHRRKPNAILVMFSEMANIQELRWMSRVTRSKKGKKTKADTLRGLLDQVGDVQLFKVMVGGRSFPKLRIDYAHRWSVRESTAAATRLAVGRNVATYFNRWISLLAVFGLVEFHFQSF